MIVCNAYQGIDIQPGELISPLGKLFVDSLSFDWKNDISTETLERIKIHER